MPFLEPKRPNPDKAKALVRRLHKLNSRERKSLERLFELLGTTHLPTLAPMLPLVLNLKGKPFQLTDHFPVETLFGTNIPRRTVLCCGRQISKSTSLAAQAVLLAYRVPFFNTLFVTPQFEQVRKLSQNYVRPFIEQSPCSSLWHRGVVSNSVLQKSFANNSSIFFSFALLDADRVRGISSDKIAFDETQDILKEFIPVILETASASQWKIEQYAGTPKTLDNTLQSLWEHSSQAEWLIPCPRCRYENVPTLTHDIEDMIGPLHKDISEEKPGVVCAKCKRPLSPRLGFWVHSQPQRAHDYAGYHVPQIIMPMHYADPEAWAMLLAKREGASGFTTATFMNECLGISYDVGSKLVSLTDLKRSATLNANTPEEALEAAKGYEFKVLAVDWGGGGDKGMSWTVYAVLGYRHPHHVDVLFGYRSLTPHDPFREAKVAVDLMTRFGCAFMVHDYGGAGTLREHFILDAGLPASKVIPMSYTGPSRQDIVRWVAPSDVNPIGHYRVDKSRSLGLVCGCIRAGIVRFFQDDYESEDNPGLLRSFLALVEDKRDVRMGSDSYAVITARFSEDDFAQAVNIGCCAIWKEADQWPNLAMASRYSVGKTILDQLSPENPDWD